jgi:hypothetical protein
VLLLKWLLLVLLQLVLILGSVVAEFEENG